MKNSLKKILMASAVTTVVALTMSLSAFAANMVDGDITYDDAAGKVTVKDTVLQGVQGQATIIIFPVKNADGSLVDEANLTADQILYINQDAATNTVTFQGMGVKTNKAGEGAIGLEKGDYVIKIGGETLTDGIIRGTFTVGTTVDIVLGDVTGEGTIDLSDVLGVFDHYLGITPLTGNALLAANVNGDQNIDLSDVLAIFDHYLGITPLA